MQVNSVSGLDHISRVLNKFPIVSAMSPRNACILVKLVFGGCIVVYGLGF